jgi:polyisoprenoid-binding protein YceI
MSTIEKTQDLTGTWGADPIHSSLGFAVKHMVVSSFRGTLPKFEATLTGEGESFRLSGVAQAASIETAEENLTGHLQSPDFFDVERTPEIRLESTSVERNGGDVTIGADLTIKGTTLPVVLRGEITDVASDPYGNERVGLTLATTINRADFGLSWNAPMPGGGFVLSNDVKLTAELEFVKAA